LQQTSVRDGTRRLVAEFVVIFVSVLAALAADQWVQSHRDREAEAAYLRRLEADLVTDSTMLADRLQASSRGLGLIEALWKELPEEGALQLPAGRPYELVGSGVPPSASSSTFDELISTGNLTLIRDVTVRRVLLEYYQNSARRSGDLENAFTRGRNPIMELAWDAGMDAPEGFRELGVRVERSELRAAVVRAATYHGILTRSIEGWQAYLDEVRQQVRNAQR